MVYHPLAGDISTPQRRRPSDPTLSTWTPSANMYTPSRSPLQTPHSGKKKSDPRTAGIPRALRSPYMTPERVNIKLFKPNEYVAREALRRKGARSTSSPTYPHANDSTNRPSKPKSKLFPPNSGFRKPSPSLSQSPSPSPKLVSPPMQGIPRQPGAVTRPRDPTCPTVQLLRVIQKCWDDDNSKDSRWTIMNDIMKGRNEERDRSERWRVLGGAVGRVWPELRDLIMRNAPSDNDDTFWFRVISAPRIDDHDDSGCISDPDLPQKDSSLDRVGFHMTPDMYNVACGIIQVLARRGRDLWCLISNKINPFFVIYACMDCDVPLPANLNRELLWKHLDAILRAKCWRGLGSGRENTQRNTRADAVRSPPSIPKGEDPDGILQILIRLSYTERVFGTGPAIALPEADEVRMPVHELQITIDKHKWVAEAQVGTVWYEAGDLDDEGDIACFAAIDTLTRWLPHCWGGILEFRTRDIRLLWGVGGAPLGAWSVVQAVCMKYQVRLRAKWNELKGPDPRAPVVRTEIIIPPRDRDVVAAVLDGFQRNKLDSEAAVCMMNHLSHVTT